SGRALVAIGVVSPGGRGPSIGVACIRIAIGGARRVAALAMVPVRARLAERGRVAHLSAAPISAATARVAAVSTASSATIAAAPLGEGCGRDGEERQGRGEGQFPEGARHGCVLFEGRCTGRDKLIWNYLPISGGLRTRVNSSIPGTAAPPSVRLTDCQPIRSLPRRVMIFVADAGSPFCTPSALTTHWLPSRVQ